MATINLQISDSLVSFANDTTRNVDIDRTLLPDNLEGNELVVIQYDEDEDGVTHEYRIHSMNKNIVSLDWVRMNSKQPLNESPIINIKDDELYNPKEVNFKDKIQDAIDAEEQEATQKQRFLKEQELKRKNEHLPTRISEMQRNHNTTSEIIEMLFGALVPTTGPAESVGGELVRAIMRLLFRSYNDGDIFYVGYGIETCGPSAEYLHDNGFESQIDSILDDAQKIETDEDEYDQYLNNLCSDVINKLIEEPELLWTTNEEDSREYSNEYIKQHELKVEFELPVSDDVEELINKYVINSYDLIRYVEDYMDMEPIFAGAEVAHPWSHQDKTVVITGLTMDAHDYFVSIVDHGVKHFWEGLVNEYSDELDDEYDD